MLSLEGKWPWINTYRYSLLGDEHPFATYFDVHQGYMVLTHSQMNPKMVFTTFWDSAEFRSFGSFGAAVLSVLRT